MFSTISKTKTEALVLLGAVLMLGISGCSSSPETAPTTQNEDPEISIERREPLGYTAPELPEPFIRVVDLARLRVGMTRSEVLALFPDPKQIRTTRAETEFWAYSFAELQFRNGRLENWFNIR
jgi:hypothetical protein